MQTTSKKKAYLFVDLLVICESQAKRERIRLRRGDCGGGHGGLCRVLWCGGQQQLGENLLMICKQLDTCISEYFSSSYTWAVFTLKPSSHKPHAITSTKRIWRAYSRSSPHETTTLMRGSVAHN